MFEESGSGRSAASIVTIIPPYGVAAATCLPLCAGYLEEALPPVNGFRALKAADLCNFTKQSARSITEARGTPSGTCHARSAGQNCVVHARNSNRLKLTNPLKLAAAIAGIPQQQNHMAHCSLHCGPCHESTMHYTYECLSAFV